LVVVDGVNLSQTLGCLIGPRDDATVAAKPALLHRNSSTPLVLVLMLVLVLRMVLLVLVLLP
jgi:hypothetical protein